MEGIREIAAAEGRGLTDEEAVWDDWLEGSSVSAMHEFLGVSKARIRAIIDAGPPETMRSDHRHVNSCRTFWIAADMAEPSPATGGRDAFAVVRMPRRCTSAAFSAAVRAMRRDLREAMPGADLRIGVLEGIPGEVGDRFVEKGYLAWSFDGEGRISRYGRGWEFLEKETGPKPR